MRIGRLIVTLPFMIGACYTYRPVTASVAPAGVRVKASLSDAGRLNVAPFVGAGVTYVEGEVLDSDASSVTIALASVKRQGEAATSWSSERLTLQRSDIAMMGERSLSRSKTGWAVAGLSAAAAIAVIAAGKTLQGLGSGGGGSGKNPPGS
jgi:hypothetical protein